MIKAAIEKIQEMAAPVVRTIDGRVYCNQPFTR